MRDPLGAAPDIALLGGVIRSMHGRSGKAIAEMYGEPSGLASAAAVPFRRQSAQWLACVVPRR